MQFFKKQKIDAAGKTGVRLQKIIIFFSVLTLIGAIFGLPFSLISAAISLGILSLGFFGAVNRNPCMLKAYAIIRILELVFHFLLVIASFIIVFIVIGFVMGGAFYQNYGSVSYAQPEPYFNNDMMHIMKHKSHHGNTVPTEGNGDDVVYNVDPLPVYEIPYYYGSVDIYYYYNYYNTLTTGQVVALTLLFAAVALISVIISLVYYGLVLYTVILSFRMAAQIKKSAAAYSALELKECQLETPQQPYIYVVADPTNGNHPVLLQPVDPSYQIQNFA